MVVKDLESLKYSELQKLAKSAGIKANQKIDKLVKALKEHYLENEDEEEESSPQTELSSCAEEQTGGKATTKTSESVKQQTKAASKGKDGPSTTFKVLKQEPQVKKASQIKPNIHSPGLFSPMHKKSPLVRKGTPVTPLSAKKALVLNGVSSKPLPGSATRTPDNKSNRKRRRTFELDEPTLSPQCTPSSDDQPEKRTTRQRTSQTKTPTEIEQQTEPSNKRIRRNTYDKDSPSQSDENANQSGRSTRASSSPGTRAMIESMDANSSSAERKQKLLSAIDKKVQGKVAASPSTAPQASQIPRFMAFLASKKKTNEQKPLTPGNKDWTKIHKREFSKFDSLDVYLDKKQKRIENLTGSAKRPAVAKSPRRKVIAKRATAAKSPKRNVPKVVKPVLKPQAEVKPFVPTVTSTKNINLNFGKTPTAPGGKTPSKPKPSVNLSVSQNVSKTPRAQGNLLSAKKSIGSTSRVTPFKFTGNNTSFNTTLSTQKNPFDLKASLAKPMTWKPHTGKLQPFDFNKPITVATVKPSVQAPKMARPSRQIMANKSRPMQAKDVRRVKQLDRRNNQKYLDMMKRRGLMA